MDSVLCDELLQEIFQRLPPSSSPSVSLVSRRWLSLLRSSITTLHLLLPSGDISLLLSHYPFLSSLSILPNHDSAGGTLPISSPDDLLLSIAASPSSPHLSHLRFLPSSPISPSALIFSSLSFPRLVSLHLSFPLPLSLRWISHFPSLKSLTLLLSPSSTYKDRNFIHDDADVDTDTDDGSKALPLESLSLSGIRSSDRGAAWLYRRCARLRRLQLRSCEGTGDGPASPVFPLCLPGLLELELSACRTIADCVLLRAADHCRSLTSLLLYDGVNRDALRRFIDRHRNGPGLWTLDLRLPLDLDNEHLSAIAAGPLGLTALRLQSCCLVTGHGLRALARSAAGRAIEELALVNCDVVEREPGLLTCLGQSLKRLRRVDLSYNDILSDKVLGAMLASCTNLVELRLRGCRKLTDASLFSVLNCCGKCLEALEVAACAGISSEGIDALVLNATRLDRVTVEEDKVSEAAAAWASRKGIKIG